jgi:hypothetical protein
VWHCTLVLHYSVVKSANKCRNNEGVCDRVVEAGGELTGARVLVKGT